MSFRVLGAVCIVIVAVAVANIASAQNVPPSVDEPSVVEDSLPLIPNGQTSPSDLNVDPFADELPPVFDRYEGADAVKAIDNWPSSKIRRSTWGAGVDATFVKPHFAGNTAFTTLESDGVSFETLADREFSYDYDLAPRAWIGYRTDAGIGLRSTYWGYDQSSSVETTTPPANGFGRVFHPTFGNVDISSTVPTETYAAASELDAFSIDLEVTKDTEFCSWGLMASAGLRYASIEQAYQGELLNSTELLAGSLDFSHELSGIGPTFAIETRRSLAALTVFANARASLLFGDGRTTFAGGEDLDLITPFLTSRSTDNEQVLPIGELQLGAEWATEVAGSELFVRGALEGQLWGDVGNASSTEGNLGFFGASVGFGLKR